MARIKVKPTTGQTIKLTQGKGITRGSGTKIEIDPSSLRLLASDSMHTILSWLGAEDVEDAADKVKRVVKMISRLAPFALCENGPECNCGRYQLAQEAMDLLDEMGAVPIMIKDECGETPDSR